jgi:hypothetical protein
MSFQPPPGDNPPPPPPPGQWGPQSGGSAGFDPKTVNSLDWGILGASLLIFIFSFINFYTYEGKEQCITVGGQRTCGGGGGSVDQSGWSGFLSLLAILLVLVGAALIAIELFAPQVKLPIANRLAALGAFALATVLLIIALFVVPDYGGGGPGYDQAVNEGHGFGYWATLILAIAATVMTLMRAQQTGTAMPGALGNLPDIGSKGPQGGTGGSYGGSATPPPPPPPAP